MVIKRKDGSTYKLQSPNYNMINQEFWNGEFINIHNFNIKKDVQPIKVIEKKTIEEKPKEIPIEPTPILEEDPILDPTQNIVEFKQTQEDESKEFHCLPAKTEIIIDQLYNEKKIKTKYLKPIKIKLTIMRNDDFEFKLSTNQDLDVGSIIFNQKDKRWWKVDSTYVKNDKYISECSPSSYEPYFED